MTKKVNIITFGCPKNLVDSEVIAGTLFKKNCNFVNSFRLADLIIINTCAFIESAQKESEEKIAQICKLKKSKQKLIVCGCLPQLKKKKLLEKFPEIDGVFGSGDFPKISKIIKKLENTEPQKFYSVGSPSFIYSSSDMRAVSTFCSGYAYLKIADGCNNRCHYCLIPKLRGNFRSRKIEDITREAKILVSSGIKELILIAQDTTMYGIDIYGKQMLNILLEKLAMIDGLHWIRLMYTHPAHFNQTIIEAIQGIDKVCKYIDIPIQHTCNEILKKMGRPDRKTIFKTIEELRKKIPDVTLRTSVMVGFPGETEEIFEKLLDDIKKLEFDWLGCFEYSRQKGTKIYHLKDTIKKNVKKSRKNKLLGFQQKITYNKNKIKLGKIYKILTEDSKYGHSEFQAPEIDGNIILNNTHKNGICAGKMILVKLEKIVGIYDFLGSPIETS